MLQRCDAAVGKNTPREGKNNGLAEGKGAEGGEILALCPSTGSGTRSNSTSF